MNSDGRRYRSWFEFENDHQYCIYSYHIIVLDFNQKNPDNVVSKGWDQIDADDSTNRKEAEGRAAEILGLINRRMEKDFKSKGLNSKEKGNMKVKAMRVIMKQSTSISKESKENSVKS